MSQTLYMQWLCNSILNGETSADSLSGDLEESFRKIQNDTKKSCTWSNCHNIRNSQRTILRPMTFNLACINKYLRKCGDIRGKVFSVAWPLGFYPLRQHHSLFCSNLVSVHPISLSIYSVVSTSQKSQKGFVGMKAFALRWLEQHLWGQKSSLLKHFLISFLYLCISVLLQIILHSFYLTTSGFSELWSLCWFGIKDIKQWHTEGHVSRHELLVNSVLCGILSQSRESLGPNEWLWNCQQHTNIRLNDLSLSDSSHAFISIQSQWKDMIRYNSFTAVNFAAKKHPRFPFCLNIP